MKLILMKLLSRKLVWQINLKYLLQFMFERKNMGWRRLIRICLFMAIVVSLHTACGKSKEMNFQDYLDLGQKYLTESNYEQAIVTFTKAIELEPKTLEAYEGLATAYIKAENYEKAQETIQRGIVLYESLGENKKTVEWKQIYEELLKIRENVLMQLEQKSNVEGTRAESFGLEKENQLITEAEERYGSVLEQIIAVMDSGKPELTHYMTDDFVNFIKGLEKPLVWKVDDERYCGLYSGTDGQAYVYLGEMEEGVRSGFGIWYSEYTQEDYRETYLFSGNWSGDYPNGAGTIAMVERENDVEIHEKVEGNYGDGYENGVMSKVVEESYDSGECYSYGYDIPVKNGIPENLGELQDDGGRVVDGTQVEVQGVKICEVYYDNQIRGIPGATK